MVDYDDMLENAQEMMGGKKAGKKKASKASRSRQQELNSLADEVAKVRMQEELAAHRDIATRYRDYDDDPSVGYMYQQKAGVKMGKKCKKGQKKGRKKPLKVTKKAAKFYGF